MLAIKQKLSLISTDQKIDYKDIDLYSILRISIMKC